MASIGSVRLEIFESPSSALVRVSYKLTATLLDAQAQQSYRELVQLIGVDEGPGEDGQNDVIAGGTIWDGPITFTTSQVAFQQIHEKTVPLSVLSEDRELIQTRDELRARVTLMPLPPASPARESNLVTRGALVTPLVNA
jgi:hypothetical protein